MNLRKGILRAVFAFGLPWALFWGWTYYDAFQKAQRHSEYAEWMIANFERVDRGAQFYGSSGKKDIAQTVQFRDEEKGRMTMAIRIGLLLPLGIAVLAAAIAWVVQGFRRSSPNN